MAVVGQTTHMKHSVSCTALTIPSLQGCVSTESGLQPGFEAATNILIICFSSNHSHGQAMFVSC